MISDEEVTQGRRDYENELVRSVYPYVVSLALEFSRNKSVPFEDALSDALIGVARAARKFDPSIAKFITLAHIAATRSMGNENKRRNSKKERFARCFNVSLNDLFQVEGDLMERGNRISSREIDPAVYAEEKEALKVVMGQLDSGEKEIVRRLMINREKPITVAINWKIRLGRLLLRKRRLSRKAKRIAREQGWE